MEPIVISQSDFEALECSGFTFTVEDTEREFEKFEYPSGVNNEDEVLYDHGFNSYVTGEATAKHGELEINFFWVAKGGSGTYADAFDFTIEIDNSGTQNFEINFTIVDEDGDEISGWWLDEILREKLSGCEWESMVQDLLPSAEIQKIDIDEDAGAGMETFTIEIDNEPMIRFTGVLMGSAASSDNQAIGRSYSGQVGRWTELELYKTKGGKFICSQVGHTRWEGERTRHSGRVCETLEEVKEFFGHRWLAKELYSRAGIDDVVDVD